MMKGFSLFTPENKPTYSEQSELVDFLFEQLGKYGDSKEEITECLKFALAESEKAIGGFALTRKDDNGNILGAAIINETGMSKYIPENILVYIAVDADTRGQGIGSQIMKKILQVTEGDIALHVDPDNPAKQLYEKLGFTNKYLEMRYQA